MRIYFNIAVISIFCFSFAETLYSSGPYTVVTEERVRKIADRELRNRDPGFEEYDLSIEEEPFLWVVHARLFHTTDAGERLYAIGDDRHIFIDELGSLIMYAGGGKVTSEELIEFEKRMRQIEKLRNPCRGTWSFTENGGLVLTGCWEYVCDEYGVYYLQYPELPGQAPYDYRDAPLVVSNGIFASHFHNGQIAHRCTISNGVVTGVWETWYPTGKRSIYGTMDDQGEHCGIWLWWNPRGEILDVQYQGTHHDWTLRFKTNGAVENSGPMNKRERL